MSPIVVAFTGSLYCCMTNSVDKALPVQVSASVFSCVCLCVRLMWIKIHMKSLLFIVQVSLDIFGHMSHALCTTASRLLLSPLWAIISDWLHCCPPFSSIFFSSPPPPARPTILVCFRARVAPPPPSTLLFTKRVGLPTRRNFLSFILLNWLILFWVSPPC